MEAFPTSLLFSVFSAVTVLLQLFSFGDGAATVFVACPTSQSCVQVGFTYSNTGSGASEGYKIERGYVLWAEKINSLDVFQPVELIGYDDESNATLAAQYYISMLENEGVIFFLGPYGSATAKAVNAALNQTGGIIIHSNAAGEDVYSQGYSNVYGVETGSYHYGDSFMNKMKSFNELFTVSIMYLESSYTISAAQGISDFITANPTHFSMAGPVHTFASNTPNSTFINILNQLKAENADIVCCVGAESDAEVVTQLSQQVGLRPKAFWLTSGPVEPDFVQNMGVSANYLMGPAQWSEDVSYDGLVFGTASSYATQFQDRFTSPGEYVNFESASATAAGLALSWAMKTSNSTLIGPVAAGLSNINITTFYGPIMFSSNGENILKGMVTTQVIYGVIEIVAPDSQRTNNMVFPIPYEYPATTSSTPSTSTSGEVSAAIAVIPYLAFTVVMIALAVSTNPFVELL